MSGETRAVAVGHLDCLVGTADGLVLRVRQPRGSQNIKRIHSFGRRIPMSPKDVSDDGTADDARKKDERPDDGAAKRFIRRHIRNREDERDVLQNTFLVFLRKTKPVRNSSALLRGIAQKLCFRQWRKDKTEGKIAIRN